MNAYSGTHVHACMFVVCTPALAGHVRKAGASLLAAGVRMHRGWPYNCPIAANSSLPLLTIKQTCHACVPCAYMGHDVLPCVMRWTVSCIHPLPAAHTASHLLEADQLQAPPQVLTGLEHPQSIATHATTTAGAGTADTTAGPGYSKSLPAACHCLLLHGHGRVIATVTSGWSITCCLCCLPPCLLPCRPQLIHPCLQLAAGCCCCVLQLA